MINIDKKDTEQPDLEPRICDSVYDYYNGALSPHNVREFEHHLIRCPACEKTIFTLDRVLNTVNEDDSLIGAVPDLPTARKDVYPQRRERKTKP